MTMRNTSSERKNFTDSKSNRILKKPHNIAGKTIVVLDPSLVQRFSINDDTWLIEEGKDEGILLRIRQDDTKG